MYAFKNPVYLVIGIVCAFFGAVLITRTGTIIGTLLVLLGLAISTFAAYQMGQSSSASRARQ
jgi:protein-S-isoprenylcysteine O-methyltransferase Ste14